MTDDDLRDKFFACAEEMLSQERVDQIIGACLDLDRCERFADVLPLLTVDHQSRGPVAAPVK